MTSLFLACMTGMNLCFLALNDMTTMLLIWIMGKMNRGSKTAPSYLEFSIYEQQIELSKLCISKPVKMYWQIKQLTYAMTSHLLIGHHY